MLPPGVAAPGNCASGNGGPKPEYTCRPTFSNNICFPERSASICFFPKVRFCRRKVIFVCMDETYSLDKICVRRITTVDTVVGLGLKHSLGLLFDCYSDNLRHLIDIHALEVTVILYVP